jgi:hypothetical protein
MAKRKSGWAWATIGVLVLWLTLTYFSTFLACVRICAPSFYFGDPPDGVGRYAHFSHNRYLGEGLHIIYWPCVSLLEEQRLALYALRADPEFYEREWPFPVPSGWSYFLRPDWRGVFRIAVGLAVGETITTVLLAYALFRWWRSRVRRRRTVAA